MLIGGRWLDASDGRTLGIVDPSSGREFASVADATVQDGMAAVAVADAASADWASTPPRMRAEILRRTFDLMQRDAEALAVLIVEESGKSLRDARAEIAYGAEFFRWFSEETCRIEGTIATAPSGSSRLIVTKEPVGLAILITPWNFPVAAPARKMAAALAAGCTFVLKPSADTPLSALAIAARLAEAGLPDGVCNVVPTSRTRELVSAMMGHPAVRKVSFTGSTEVGQHLLRMSADRVIRTSLELGGNAPFIVFADADLDAAVAAAVMAKMRNGGQACTAANRFYVERPVARAFAEGVSAAIASLVVGPGLDAATDVGPMINAAARTKVRHLIEAAESDGAMVQASDRVLPSAGFYQSPTVLLDVPPTARVVTEESFGPVAPIIAFDSFEEAIAMANSTPHGLASYVCGGDLARVLRVADRLRTGMVGINRGLISDPAAPFGGIGMSGTGREGGHLGLEAFLETKYVAVQW